MIEMKYIVINDHLWFLFNKGRIAWLEEVLFYIYGILINSTEQSDSLIS